MENTQTYEQGFKDGDADNRAWLAPKPLKGYPKEYRDGYSDGFRAGAEKQW